MSDLGNPATMGEIFAIDEYRDRRFAELDAQIAAEEEVREHRPKRKSKHPRRQRPRLPKRGMKGDHGMCPPTPPAQFHFRQR